MATGTDGTWVTINGAHILLGSPAHTALLKRIQQRRQAMKDTAREATLEAETCVEAACLILAEFREVTPPGFEHVVKSLKRKKGVENPWAVAWAMKNRGAEPKAKKEAAVAFASELLEQAARLVEAVDNDALTDNDVRQAWSRTHPNVAVSPGEATDTGGWIQAILVGQSAVIVDRRGKTFRVPYTITDDDKITFDDMAATEVRHKDIWEPVKESAADEAGTSAGAKAGWERRKRGGDPKPAATPEEIGAERREFARRSKAARFSSNKKRKMDLGGTVSPRTERLRRIKALDQHFAQKYANIGAAAQDRALDQGLVNKSLRGHPSMATRGGRQMIDPKLGNEDVLKLLRGRGRQTEAAAYEILEDLDFLLEALTDEAGTSAGAKAGWEKRKGGGGKSSTLKRPPVGTGEFGEPLLPSRGKRKRSTSPALPSRAAPNPFATRFRGKRKGSRTAPNPFAARFDPKDPRRQQWASESTQPVRATFVIREAAGMSSLPQLGRAGVRVPGRSGSGLVRKDDGSVERVPVQKGSFHDDLRRKTSLRRVMHKTPQPKVGAA